MWSYKDKPNYIKKVENYKKLMDENSSKIQDLQTINDALIFQMVENLKKLLRENFLSPNLIRDTKIWDKVDKREEWFKNRLFAYYNLEVDNVKCVSLGYGTDCFLIEFDYEDNRYQLTIPNLKGLDNYKECYGGYYNLHIKESEHVWGLIKNNKQSYMIEDVLKPLIELKQN